MRVVVKARCSLRHSVSFLECSYDISIDSPAKRVRSPVHSAVWSGRIQGLWKERKVQNPRIRDVLYIIISVTFGGLCVATMRNCETANKQE